MIKGFKYLKKSKISSLPKTSGVYCFLNKRRKLLYIGKALNIKKRVKNHFSHPTYKHNLFESKVVEIGYQKTDSEIKALILEANLIKKHKPKYNIVWKDDKNYFYIGITKEDFPRVFLTHQTKTKSKFIGPFIDGNSLRQVLKILRKILPYRTCINLPKKPCLWHQLDRCTAPCLLNSKLARQLPDTKDKMKNEYQKNIKNLVNILKGEKLQTLKDLKKEMKMASGTQDFEKASKIRDQIFSLERVLQHAKISPTLQFHNIKKGDKTLKEILNLKKTPKKIEAYDVSNIQGKMATGSMVAFVNGKPNKNLYRRFKIRTTEKPNDTAMIKEILRRRLNHPEWEYPDLILIDGGRSQFNAALQCLKRIPVISLAKKKNELFVAVKGKPFLLKDLPREVSNLILQLRDEAHRFAIAYHKKLRKKQLLAS